MSNVLLQSIYCRTAAEEMCVCVCVCVPAAPAYLLKMLNCVCRALMPIISCAADDSGTRGSIVCVLVIGCGFKFYLHLKHFFSYLTVSN